MKPETLKDQFLKEYAVDEKRRFAYTCRPISAWGTEVKHILNNTSVLGPAIYSIPSEEIILSPIWIFASVHCNGCTGLLILLSFLSRAMQGGCSIIFAKGLSVMRLMFVFIPVLVSESVIHTAVMCGHVRSSNHIADERTRVCFVLVRNKPFDLSYAALNM